MPDDDKGVDDKGVDDDVNSDDDLKVDIPANHLKLFGLGAWQDWFWDLILWKEKINLWSSYHLVGPGIFWPISEELHNLGQKVGKSSNGSY